MDNKVRVDGGVAKSLMEKTKSGISKTGKAITDTWITSKVKDHYIGEDLPRDSNISVETNNHVVTLKTPSGLRLVSPALAPSPDTLTASNASSVD